MRTTPERFFVPCLGLMLVLSSCTATSHQSDQAGAHTQAESEKLREIQTEETLPRLH